MDYRLDLYNAITNYQNNMDKHDSLFVICHNCKDGDLVIGLDGDVDFISSILSNYNGYVNIKTKEDKLRHEYVKSMVLNMAINILKSDSRLKDLFIDGMESNNMLTKQV